MSTDGPIRMCLACRTRRSQRQLVRMARVGDTVRIDEDRRRIQGRGAYICPDARCIALSERKRLLERVFRGCATDELYSSLRIAASRIARVSENDGSEESEG